jgi:hypothetical protein
LIAGWSLNLEGAQRFSAGADINTDDRNQLATRSAGLGNEALRGKPTNKLFAPFDPLPLRAAEFKTTYLVRRLASRGESARAVKLAKKHQNSTQRMTNLGWATATESPSRAIARFRAALKQNPAAQSARFGLLKMTRRPSRANDPDMLELAEPLEGPASAVVSGWRLAAAGEWQALRELEPELASAVWFDPAYQDAQRLRAQWRAASDDPVLHAEAVAIASDFLRSNAVSEDLLVGAQAFAAADQGESAVRLLEALSKRRPAHWIVQAAVELIDSLPPEVDKAQRAAIRDRFTRRPRPVKTSVNGG